MREKSKEKHYDFYQAYREYIEFVNELSIVPPASTIFLLVSSTIIITDLLLELAPDNHFIRDVTYLGLSTTLYEIARKNDVFCYTLVGIVLFALLSPLIAILSIVIATYSIEKP